MRSLSFPSLWATFILFFYLWYHQRKYRGQCTPHLTLHSSMLKGTSCNDFAQSGPPKTVAYPLILDQWVITTRSSNKYTDPEIGLFVCLHKIDPETSQKASEMEYLLSMVEFTRKVNCANSVCYVVTFVVYYSIESNIFFRECVLWKQG